MPAAYESSPGVWRCAYSTRDDRNRSRIGHFDFSLDGTPRVLAKGLDPDIDLGPLGAFDDNGATSSCVVEHQGALYQYYTGWSLGVTVPFYLSAGLAVSEDGGAAFQKVSAAPILERTSHDPFLTASPWVIVDAGMWRMWYVSAVRWTLEDGRPKHHYLIKYAESNDGIAWRREGVVCIDFASPDEYALSRPCVVKDGALYRMWFSARGQAYRLAYAESADGVVWRRCDGAQSMAPPAGAWEAEMTAYPCVIQAGPLGRWMLYNGNGYGETGIGLARETGPSEVA